GLDLGGRAHAGRDDQRLLGRGQPCEQGKIGQVGGGNLVGLHAEGLEHGNACRIPWRAEILNALRGAVVGNLALLIGGELETAQKVECIFDREVVILSGEGGGAVDL